ncbi:thioredoxin domain-containing protein [Candidatus Orientia mediorientalis]|uniref:thioredoxin domain-containing protein n=1 Tax=Candidatus Orientia mediorientalis TaxID=911112 RepID=UPI001E4B7584|nr:thioredoxin domain-containing protein [Candidatus Orientia mediorientalis]
MFSKSNNLVEHKSNQDINQYNNSQQAVISEDKDNNTSKTNDNENINSLENIKSILKINNYDIILGNKESNIKVFEYFSYTCYHCARYHTKVFPQIKQKFIDTNEIAYITREFITSKQDLDGAMLSRCGGPLMWNKFHSVLLEQQDKWVFSKNYMDWLKNIGKISGFTENKFFDCFKDEELSHQLMLNSVNISKFDEVFDGTPCIIAVINDEQIIKIEDVIKEISIIVEKQQVDNTKK